MMARRPNLFLIGAPKAGTTSLYEYLRGHPDIYMSSLKEPFYFSPDVFRGPTGRFRYGIDEEAYLELFAEARDERLVGEASTHYLASSEAPHLIRAFEPAARIVAILRNPVDMVHAWHNERVLWGMERETDFARALAADHAGSGVYTAIAAYGSQLERWLEMFDRSAVHVMVFDDFVANTPREFGRLLAFLGVDQSFRPRSFAIHNQSAANRWDASLLRTRPFRAAVRTAKVIVGKSNARTLGRNLRSTRLMRRPRARPPMGLEVREALERRFEPELEVASELLGRDLVSLWMGRVASYSVPSNRDEG
jgi:hypothetical protein